MYHLSPEYGRKQYRHLNNELRRETDNAREKWMEEQCEKIEELEKYSKTKDMQSCKEYIKKSNFETGNGKERWESQMQKKTRIFGWNTKANKKTNEMEKWKYRLGLRIEE